MSKLAYYGSYLSPNIVQTDEGYIICKNVPIGRLGQMDYLAQDLGIASLPADEVITVARDEHELFDLAALASFEGKPVTDDHPPGDVEASNWAMYAKGHAQNIRRGKGDDKDKVIADLFIKDSVLAAKIADGQKREVSCGYHCVYLPFGDGYRQEQIRGNHIAVVSDGRAGASVAIRDEKSVDERRKSMLKEKNPLTHILNLVATGAKDAKTPDEIEQVVENGAEAIKAVSERPEEKPTEDSDATPESDDKFAALETKVNDLASKFGAFVDSFSAGQTKDGASEPPAEDPEDEADADGGTETEKLDKLVASLESEEDVEDEDDVPSVAEQEEAVTVAPEDLTDDEATVIAKDTALKILRGTRSAIAKIQDSAVRASVSDALRGSVEDALSDPYSAVLTTARAAAVNVARDAASAADPWHIEERQASYDKFNPHIKKGDK
jgi:hypothetical protein